MCTFTIRAGNTHREFVANRDGATFETVGGCSIWGLKQGQFRRTGRFTGRQVTGRQVTGRHATEPSEQISRTGEKKLTAVKSHTAVKTRGVQHSLDTFRRFYYLFQIRYQVWLHYSFTSLLLDHEF